MTTPDVILLIIVVGFTLFGFWFGLIHTLGSLVGTVLGAFLASRYFDVFAGWLTSLTGFEGNWVRIFAFAFLFIIINRLIGFLFWVFEKTFGIVTKLPFISSINKIAGLVLGTLEGLITIGLVLHFVHLYPLSTKFMGWVDNSAIAPYAEKSAALLLPLLPEALKALEKTADFVEEKVL